MYVINLSFFCILHFSGMDSSTGQLRVALSVVPPCSDRRTFQAHCHVLLYEEGPVDLMAALVVDKYKRILSVDKLDEAVPGVRVQVDVIPSSAQLSHWTKRNCHQMMIIVTDHVAQGVGEGS